MGRKKQKTKNDTDDKDVVQVEEYPSQSDEQISAKIAFAAIIKKHDVSAPPKSAYAVASHTGEIFPEDIYLSDGSRDSDDDEIQVLLIGSKLGIMRRGTHQLTSLQQPNRQWSRQINTTEGGKSAGSLDKLPAEISNEQKRKVDNDALARLDPAQRAARLLQEKLRKAEEAKEVARQIENQENASKDPTLFSKRTAFDIRFDQIDDRPWSRGSGDVSDFFNYGMTEDDWLEYAQQQLIVRQELIDAVKQTRTPDPTLVPFKTQVDSSSHAPDAAKGLNHDANIALEGSDSSLQNAITDSTEIKLRFSANRNCPETQFDDDEEDERDDIGGAWNISTMPESILSGLIETATLPLDHGDAAPIAVGPQLSQNKMLVTTKT